METYNYDNSSTASSMADSKSNEPAAPGFGPSGTVTPALPNGGSSQPAAPGFGPAGAVTPTLPDNGSNQPAAPGFGPAGAVTPALPDNGFRPVRPNYGPAIAVTPALPAIRPNNGVLWTWGTLAPFFSTSTDISHVRFYNAAAMREPLDIYLNGRLLVSNLDYMNYTRYLHIIPGIYRLTVFSRTNPQSAIIDTSVRFRSGSTYTMTILGTNGDYSIQMLTA